MKVTASRCNLLIKDVDSKFDLSSPDGFYTLQMENAYDRAVCIKLLRLIANHGTFVFKRFAHDRTPNVMGRANMPRGGSRQMGTQPPSTSTGVCLCGLRE